MKHHFISSCFVVLKVWINAGDIILLGLRDFQVHKHTVL